jgi:hypothetical protein
MVEHLPSKSEALSSNPMPPKGCRYSSVIECLPSMQEALNFIPKATKTNKNTHTKYDTNKCIWSQDGKGLSKYAAVRTLSRNVLDVTNESHISECRQTRRINEKLWKKHMQLKWEILDNFVLFPLLLSALSIAKVLYSFYAVCLSFHLTNIYW